MTLQDIPYVTVINATPVSETVVNITFSDGLNGNLDLTQILRGPLYEDIKNKGELMRFIVSGTTGTLEWSNGLDIAPETLWVATANLPRDF